MAVPLSFRYRRCRVETQPLPHRYGSPAWHATLRQRGPYASRHTRDRPRSLRLAAWRTAAPQAGAQPRHGAPRHSLNARRANNTARHASQETVSQVTTERTVSGTLHTVTVHKGALATRQSTHDSPHKTHNHPHTTIQNRQSNVPGRSVHNRPHPLKEGGGCQNFTSSEGNT